MSAPHADRDKSEQPDEVTLAEHGRNVREVAREVYGAEIERLRDEVERLTNERDRAREECGHEKAMRASQREELMQHFSKRREAEAERERLAEVVARVERVRQRLLDPVQHVTEGPLISRIKAESWLRAALSGPTPAETPQNGPEPALSREQGTSGQSGEGEALRGAHGNAEGCVAHQAYWGWDKPLCDGAEDDRQGHVCRRPR